MKVVAYNLTHGKACVANVAIISSGWIAQLLANRELAQAYAAWATFAFVGLQVIFFVVDKLRTRGTRRR